MNKLHNEQDHTEWYLEYQIHKHRPGLFGDITSVLGMLQINIHTINGLEHHRRGLLLECADERRISLLKQLLNHVSNITITKLRHPLLRDRLALRHGKYIESEGDLLKTFRFIRDELGLLVDFLAEIMKEDGHQLIGVRGKPRVGKTEAIVASSVSANKRWIFLSSTLLIQTIKEQFLAAELSDHHVYIIDGLVSMSRGTEKHQQLLQEALSIPATKVIEHPDMFIKGSDLTLESFDYMIELRHTQDEHISYDAFQKNTSLNQNGWG